MKTKCRPGGVFWSPDGRALGFFPGGNADRPAAPRAGRAEALHYASGAAPIEVPSGISSTGDDRRIAINANRQLIDA